jgi:hypothetical protein
MQFRPGAILLALLVVPAAAVFGQIDTGVISGKVTDPSGAVVPGAQITVTQTETNIQSVAQSNVDGMYRVPSLRPGPYKVSVTAAGFKALSRDGLTLRIGENLAVDVALEVGSVAESVEVTVSLPLLETQTSSTGQVMSGDYFYTLPNYQHWQKGVLFYTPQVQHSNQVWPGSLSGWSINGGNSYQIGYFEDGQLATRMDGGTTINSISVGVDEVKVLSTVLPAEYGHATTGALSVVKKAGTNTLHGNAGYLFKNDPLVHRRFFQAQTVQQQGITALFQQPDFVVSGPVVIPKIYNGKNRTFFQVGGSYHVDTNSNASSYSVPTEAMLNGDFNFPGATANKIYDPASTTGSFAAGDLARTPFPNNIIPSSRFSQMWKAIAANNPYAKPNNPGSFSGTGVTGNILKDGAGEYYGLGTQFRVDHQLTGKLRMFASLIWNDNHQPSINNVITYAPYDNIRRYTPTLQNAGTVGFTYTISPTLISETRIGEYRITNNPFLSTPEDQFAIAKTVPNLASNAYLNPVNIGYSTQGKYGDGNLGIATLSTRVDNNRQFREDLTKVWGRHAFKFGYEFLWQNMVSHDIGNPRLTLTFGGTSGLQGNGQSIPNTGGITLADAMLGYVYSYSYAQQGASLLPENSIHSAYFQDDWRIHPKLTLNLGLRYSNESPAHSKFPGQLSVGSLTVSDTYFKSSIAGVVTCPPSGCVGGWIQPKGGLYSRDKNNFQPRIGFAWNVTPDTVIRGGWALMTLDMNLWYTNQSEIGGSSFYNTGTITVPNNVYTPLFHVNSGVPAPSYPAMLPNGTIPSAGTNPQNRANGTLNIIDGSFHNPYTQNWNLSIQRALKRDYLIELTYSGSQNVGFQGTYNWQSRPYGTGTDANGNVIDLTKPENWAYRNTWVQNSTLTQAYKPYPSWNGVNYYCNCITRIYHSGTIKSEKRYSNGLTYLTFFTWQKGLENAPGNLYQPQNLMRAVTSLTQKFRFASSLTYELPFGRGKAFASNGGRFMDWLVGGYSLAWNYMIWTPTPLSTSYSGASYRNPVTGAMGSRQDYPSYEPLPGSSLFRLKDPRLRDNWQDLGGDRWTQAGQNSMITNCGTAIPNVGNDCVMVAPSFTNGNMPSNMWAPQRIIGANVSMYKDFTIKERYKAQIRLDFFNPFKWYNWNTVNTTMAQTSPNLFGKVTGPQDFNDSVEGGPPEMQLSFRIRF